MAVSQHMTPFEVGQIKAHMEHDLGPSDIASRVKKPDGKSHYSAQAIADAMATLQANTKWRGERKEGSGRKRATSSKLDRDIVKEVFKSRGKVKVTVAYIQRKLPAK